MKKIIIAIFIGFLLYTFYSFYREELPSEKKIIASKQITTTEGKEIVHAKKQPRTRKKVARKGREKKIEIPSKDKKEKKDETYIEMDRSGNMLVTSVFIDGEYVVYQGDILVAEKEDFYKNGMDKKPLIVGRPKLWPGGKVPYEIESGLTNVKAINDAIEFFNENTDVRFVLRQGEKGYVEFKKGEHNCYASLGYKEKKRQVVLEKGCGKKEILHELMHILGFFHEQCREDRDDYLIVIWDNIDEKFHPQFKKIPMSLMHIKGSNFDFNSIMLYGPSFFALYPGEFTMTTTSSDIYKGNTVGELSQGDIVRINSIY